MVNQGERWIDCEIEFLRNYFHEGMEYCAYRLGRSISGVRKQAIKLGLVIPKPLQGYRKGSRKEWRERAKCSI